MKYLTVGQRFVKQLLLLSDAQTCTAYNTKRPPGHHKNKKSSVINFYIFKWEAEMAPWGEMWVLKLFYRDFWYNHWLNWTFIPIAHPLPSNMLWYQACSVGMQGIEGSWRISEEVTSYCQLACRGKAADPRIDLQFALWSLCTYVCVWMCRNHFQPFLPPGIERCMSPLRVCYGLLLLLLLTVPSWEHGGPWMI